MHRASTSQVETPKKDDNQKQATEGYIGVKGTNKNAENVIKCMTFTAAKSSAVVLNFFEGFSSWLMGKWVWLRSERYDC